MKGVIIIKGLKPVHEDERGKIIDLVNLPLRHAGFIKTNAGAITGCHYHKESIQYNYIISGKFEVSLVDIREPNKTEKVILEEGDFIEIAPGIIHRFKAITDADLIDLISKSRERNMYEDDVVRVEMKED